MRQHLDFGFAQRWTAVMVVAALLLSANGRRVDGQQTAGRVAAIGTGAIVGVVRDDNGGPVLGAQVQVQVGVGFSTLTDSAGKFALRGLPLGSAMVSVRRIGFSPLELSKDVGDNTVTLELQLSANPVALPAIRVQARRQPYDARLSGFYARLKEKLGYYITRADIENSHSLVLSDALRRVPGIQPYQMPRGLGTTVRMAGEACPPLVMIDGFPAAMGNFDLDMINLTTVEGIEVYRHGTSVPPELYGPYGMHNCGVIAIWSRPMRSNVRAYQLPPEHPLNLDSLMRADVVYTPGTVNQAAAYLQGTISPVYPDSLLRVRVAGHVLARFVVDTAGAVEPRTVTVVSTTDSLFGVSVRAALPTAKFSPAMLDGHPVRQMVEMPFEFHPPASDSAKALGGDGGGGGAN